MVDHGSRGFVVKKEILRKSIETCVPVRRFITQVDGMFASIHLNFNLKPHTVLESPMKKSMVLAVAVISASMLMNDLYAQPPEGRGDREGERKAGPRDGDRERGPRDGNRERGPRDGGERGPGRPGGEGGRGFGGFRMPPNPLMIAIDTDNDGELSSKELEGAVAALKKLDKNNDGKLSAEEMRPARPEGGLRGPGGPGAGRGSMMDRLMQADKNKDGKLQKDELPSFIADRLMETGDKNKDDVLDKEEIEALSKQGFGRPQRGDRPEGGRPPRGDRPDGERPPRGDRPEGVRPARPE